MQVRKRAYGVLRPNRVSGPPHRSAAEFERDYRVASRLQASYSSEDALSRAERGSGLEQNGKKWGTGLGSAEEDVQLAVPVYPSSWDRGYIFPS